MGLILDTGILIVAERTAIDVSSMAEILGDNTREHDFAISAITLAELAHAQKRGAVASVLRFRKLFLQSVQDSFAVHSINAAVAISAGLIEGDLKAEGKTIGLADVLIAATAMHVSYGVLTLNADHFRRVPGLRVVDASLYWP